MTEHDPFCHMPEELASVDACWRCREIAKIRADERVRVLMSLPHD